MTKNKFPNRMQVVQKIQEVRKGIIQREEASSWAFEFIDNDNIEVNDQQVWDTLLALGGVDLLGNGENYDEYLYTDEDLLDWIEALL